MQTVLVVEPYAALRVTVGDVLEFAGYKALLAGSASEGVQIAERGGLHAALVAVDLNEGDGAGGISVVRKLLAACPAMLVIVTSPHRPIRELASLVRHLEKPYSIAALERALMMTVH